MLGRRGVLVDWVAAVRGTLAVRRARGQRRFGLAVGGVVLTLAFLGLFVLGIRAEIGDSGDRDDSTRAESAQSDVPALAGAGTSSTTGDGGADGDGTTTTGDGSTSTDAPGTTGATSTSSTGVLGREASTTSQGPARQSGGSGGSTVITTTTTTSSTSTTPPPGSTSPTTAPGTDPGLVGGLLDLLGLG